LQKVLQKVQAIWRLLEDKISLKIQIVKKRAVIIIITIIIIKIIIIYYKSRKRFLFSIYFKITTNAFFYKH